MKAYYVYILSNQSRTLYIGMTNDLEFRLKQHKSKQIDGFTSRYNVTQLVFFESFPSAREAIAMEKRLKGWTRKKKIELIESSNPQWDDLSAVW